MEPTNHDEMHFTKDAFYVCSLCECHQSCHVYYYHCPLLENEMICVDCCHTEVPEDKVIPKLEKLGKKYTREEIDKICTKCALRCVGEKIDDI